MHQVVVGSVWPEKIFCSYFFKKLTVPIITLSKSVPPIPRNRFFFHIRLVHLKTFRGREKSRLMMIVTRPTQSLKLLIFIDFDWISWANLALKFFCCAQSITTCYKSSICNKSQIHISGVLIIYHSQIWISKLTFEKPKTKKNYLLTWQKIM